MPVQVLQFHRHALFDAIDAYMAENDIKSRPEAIRQLVQKALTATPS
jgi:metal-responsive CopG/Arc/MetJ family transcriptional regulator